MPPKSSQSRGQSNGRGRSSSQHPPFSNGRGMPASTKRFVRPADPRSPAQNGSSNSSDNSRAPSPANDAKDDPELKKLSEQQPDVVKPCDGAADANYWPEHETPPHLEMDGDSEQPPSRPKRPPISCLVVKLRNLPMYATKDDVKLLIASILHKDGFASRGHSKMVGLVNFEVLMETLYSSARNKGTAYVLLPYGYFGHRLLAAEKELEMVDFDADSNPIGVKKLQVFPITHHEPTPSKMLLLQKTPYQNPKILSSLQEKKRLLSGDILLDGVQLGSLLRAVNPVCRVFSGEWTKSFNDMLCHLFFEDNLRSFRIKYAGHTDVMAYSIVVPLKSIKSMFYGLDFGHHFVVLLLETAPAYEMEGNFLRPEDAPRKDVENTRQRLSYLDDKHRVTAPFAFQLRFDPATEEGFNDFLQKARIASLPRPVELKSPGLEFETRNVYSRRALDDFRGWVKDIDFVVAFQLEALVRNLLVDPATMLKLRPEFGRLLKSEYSNGVKSDILREFAFLIRKEVPAGCLHWDLPRLRVLLEDAKKANEKLVEKTVKKEAARAKANARRKKGEETLSRVLDRSVFLCHHVGVTPSGVRLEGPFPVLSNRVLRKYPDHQDCFIRVHFTDEEQYQFRWDREVDGVAFVRGRVGGVLKQGLELAGRYFEFLAYSFGALKEHTVWFVTPFIDQAGKSVTAESIRDSLGDFSKVIYHPSLYGARLSQAFSATYPSVRVEASEVEQIPDIYDPSGENVMSDGCAPCSTQLAKDIDDVLMEGKSRYEYNPVPKAYQIRIGGSKGMIYVDPTLPGRKLLLRPSMNKFDAPDSLDIEVSNIPRASHMYLNRPLVMLLEDLGVRLSTFKQLQEDTMAADLDAARHIGRFIIGMNQIGLGKRFYLSYVLGELADMEFGLRDDCQGDFGSLLDDYWYHGIVKSTLWDQFRKIKYQARIRVPDSWTLVGVLDEHQILQTGQIMAYVQNEDYPNGYFLKGPVLICRSPVVHPGDVQMVEAVVPPDGSILDVERLPNCVIFSALGARSIPSCLGGGDLDGDLFHVSEYPYFRIKQPYLPAAYPTPERRKLKDREATIDDVADFVVEYINSDVLGLVATTHLVIADQHPDGVRAHKCMQLAELHSTAVDYAKTGIPVPRMRIPHYEFPAKPDWKADEVDDPTSADYYESQRALGHLYRGVGYTSADDLEKNLGKHTRTAEDVDRDISSKIQERIEEHVDLETDPPVFHEELMKLYQQYVYELRRISTLHSLKAIYPLTEIEVMLGVILGKTSQPKRRKELAARMHVHTSQLVTAVMGELMPDDADEESTKTALHKAWQAWRIAEAQPTSNLGRGHPEKPFGAKSFGILALSAIFKILDGLNERSARVDENPLATMDDFDMD
ncbi:RdRP-domain-containing protein [Auricularia subglabra TFB-10046 SS5]|nr:RdRP-domain-containing protein [Auricularia subglabra TFB-10046 SS5]